jgi:hypothetical protein
MTRQRITDADIERELANAMNIIRETASLVANTAGLPDLKVTLHLGSDGVAKYDNQLLYGHTNLWSDGRGGRSKRDAYNTLRAMSLGVALAHDLADELIGKQD